MLILPQGEDDKPLSSPVRPDSAAKFCCPQEGAASRSDSYAN